MRRHHGGEREAIHVVDVPGRQRRAGRNHFVARGKNRHAGSREHVDVGAADGGQGADATRRQHVARPDHGVAAAPADVLSRRRRGEYLDLVVAARRRLFDHHDRVCARRQRRAGGDFGARAVRDRDQRQLSRIDAIEQPQSRGRGPRRARRVGRHDRVTIHRGAGERRDVDAGADLVRGHASGRCFEALALGPRDRTHVRLEPPARFLERDRGGESSHRTDFTSATRIPQSAFRNASVISLPAAPCAPAPGSAVFPSRAAPPLPILAGRRQCGRRRGRRRRGS